MDGVLWGQLLFVLVLVIVNAFFAASEMAIVSVRPSKIKALMEDGNRAAKTVNKFIEQPSKLLATIQVGITFAGFFASAFGANTLAVKLAQWMKTMPKLAFYADAIALVVVTFVISFITIILGEMVPKRIALQHSEKVALKVGGVIHTISILTLPVVKLLTITTNTIIKLSGGDSDYMDSSITEEEIRSMINVGEEKGIFRETETDMINSIFEFDDTVVKEVMTPRTDIVSIDVEDSLDEILEAIVDEHFSRIPVYEETIDNIIGLLYVKDIFPILKANKTLEFSLKDMIRPAFFVPEYKKIDVLFKEMQKSKTHIAIVIDEYGGTAGLITIEDLLEEIVGNIFDEYDEEILDYEKINSNTYMMNGMMSIDDLNDLLHSDIPVDEEFDTISGLILSISGKMPEVGDAAIFENISFRVEEVEDKRIAKIKVMVLEEQTKKDEDEE